MSQKRSKQRRAKPQVERVPWSDDIGAALRADREARGVTREALAKDIGCSGSRIRELEVNRDPKGRPTRPSPRLAEALKGWFKDHPRPRAAAPVKPKPKRASKGKAQAERVAAEPVAVTAQVLNDDDETALTA
jgi:hypothetical protein